jgi:hypothetical protein
MRFRITALLQQSRSERLTPAIHLTAQRCNIAFALQPIVHLAVFRTLKRRSAEKADSVFTPLLAQHRLGKTARCFLQSSKFSVSGHLLTHNLVKYNAPFRYRQDG